MQGYHGRDLSMTRPRIPILLLALCLTGISAFAQKTTALRGKPPAFSESEAADALAGMRQSLQAYDKSAFLKLFDSGRMADYPSFRDEISQFFDKYQSFVVNYQLQQVSSEDGAGIVLASFAMEAAPSDRTAPNLRRNVQLRLVMQWNGKQWKIVDLAPLGLFS
jgi:hypothetical protein